MSNTHIYQDPEQYRGPMIWIALLAGMAAWLGYNRLARVRVARDKPLGMPEGTIRALIAMLVASMPLTYLVTGGTVPSVVVSTTFVVVLFYMQKRARRVSDFKSMFLATREGVLARNAADGQARNAHPAYLPRYTVRATIAALVLAFVLGNAWGPRVDLASQGTIADLVASAGIYLLGTTLAHVNDARVKARIKERVSTYVGVPAEELYEDMRVEEAAKDLAIQSWTGIAIITTTIVALALLTVDAATGLQSLEWHAMARDGLLLLVNAYFGYRQ